MAGGLDMDRVIDAPNALDPIEQFAAIVREIAESESSGS
jgi:hypothetical protein